MSNCISRRRVLLTGSLALAGTQIASILSAQTTQPSASAKKPKPPPLDKDLVREFVAAAHGNLDRTRELLGSNPTIVNACWDWGGGDWETGLGGASHMGRADIAKFLLENSARMDLFAAAMLGKIEIVKAACAAFPGIIHVRGPHGIPLLEHARKGGGAAGEVLEFLQSLG